MADEIRRYFSNCECCNGTLIKHVKNPKGGQDIHLYLINGAWLTRQQVRKIAGIGDSTFCRRASMGMCLISDKIKPPPYRGGRKPRESKVLHPELMESHSPGMLMFNGWLRVLNRSTVER